MGFYGSVYYQLINTFYKIVAKNEGKNITTFTDVPDDLLVTEAIGRKGVINLDSGNRWITFSKTGTDGPIKLWHNGPNNNATQNFVGIKQQDYEVKNADNFLLNNGKTYIQLTDHDFLQTYETKVDEAGHTLPPKEVIYRLPKAEVNDKVDRLEELVGTSDGRNFPEMSEGNDNLYGYVEKNINDISTLSTYVGDWPNATNPDNYSITDVIGNVNDLFDTSYLGSTAFKSLVEIIGSMKKLWDTYDTNLTDYKYSLVQTILDLKQRYDTYVKNNDIAVNGNSNDINIVQDALGLDNRGELGTVYTEIKNLYTGLNELDTAYKDADSNLDLRLDNAESAIKTINEATFVAVNNSINDLDKRIEAHEKSWAGSEAALTEDIKELNDNLSALSTTVSTEDSKITQSIESLKTELSEADNANKQELQEQIDSLQTDLGTKTGTLDAFTAIKTNTDDIATINTKIGEVPDKSLAAQISEINSFLPQYAKSSELENYVTKKELEDKDYALNSTVTGITEQIAKIEKSFTALGDPEEFADKVGDTTLLQSIFNQLEQLNTNLATVQSDITTIKEKMNELHSENPPFPTEDEGVTTE